MNYELLTIYFIFNNLKKITIKKIWKKSLKKKNNNTNNTKINNLKKIKKFTIEKTPHKNNILQLIYLLEKISNF